MIRATATAATRMSAARPVRAAKASSLPISLTMAQRTPGRISSGV